MESEANAPKRVRKNATNRWSTQDKNFLLEIIEYMVAGDPSKFEKPTAHMFYLKIIEMHPDHFSCYGWKAMRDKMRNLRAKYTSAIYWRNNTGNQIEAEDAEKTIRENMLRFCEDFDALDVIFAGKTSKVPTYMHESRNSSEVTGEGYFLEDPTVDEESSSNYNPSDYLSQVQGERQVLPETTSQQDSAKNHQHSVIKKERKGNSSAAFLAKVRKHKIDYLKEKLHFKNETSNKKLKLEWAKLKNQKEKDMEEVRLRELEIKNNFEIQKLRLEKEMALREMELKFKYGKE